MTLDDWLTQATADAASRGLLDLRPLLDAIARATKALRNAPWNADASGTAASADTTTDA